MCGTPKNFWSQNIFFQPKHFFRPQKNFRYKIFFRVDYTRVRGPSVGAFTAELGDIGFCHTSTQRYWCQSSIFDTNETTTIFMRQQLDHNETTTIFMRQQLDHNETTTILGSHCLNPNNTPTQRYASKHPILMMDDIFLDDIGLNLVDIRRYSSIPPSLPPSLRQTPTRPQRYWGHIMWHQRDHNDIGVILCDTNEITTIFGSPTHQHQHNDMQRYASKRAILMVYDIGARNLAHLWWWPVADFQPFW